MFFFLSFIYVFFIHSFVFDLLHKQVDIMKRLHHPNILRLYELFDCPTHMILILELLNGGELFDKIVEMQHFSEKQASDVIKSVLSALVHMHSVRERERERKRKRKRKRERERERVCVCVCVWFVQKKKITKNKNKQI